ncbi:hypothetical protein [Pirellula sp. SH-Sr6A]|uniref:hypothetical protein n=1 Tax=Pirellula sp. SH-Sr6A TaxID=1632865 RepID=UPI0011BA72CC|nr:hypothetical protein [Pirellula sp. SH-Sr6A]
MKIAISFALLFSLLSMPFASGEEIRWKFVAGERWAMESEQSTEMQIGDDESEKISLQQTLTWQASVEQVSQDGTATVSQELVHAKLTVRSVRGEQSFDSKASPNGTNNPYWNPTRAQLGRQVRTQIRPTGEAIEIPPSGESAGATEAHPVSYSNLLGTNHSSFSTPGVGIQFPKNEIEIGRPWNIQSKWNLGDDEVLVDSTYQYVGTEVIGATTLDKFKSSTGARFASASAQAKITKQDFAGTIWFDRQLGKVTRLESAQELIIAVPGSPHQRLLQSMELRLVPVR